MEFRTFMFERIYHSHTLEHDREKASYVINKLYEYYLKNPNNLPHEFRDRETNWDIQTIIVDYIAGLTDKYAVQLFKSLFIPSGSFVY